MSQIVIDKVVKEYAVGSDTIVAVENVSLTIEKGSFVSIVGHSGSGKTTLLSLVGGMFSPTAGRVGVPPICYFGQRLRILESRG